MTTGNNHQLLAYLLYRQEATLLALKLLIDDRDIDTKEAERLYRLFSESSLSNALHSPDDSDNETKAMELAYQDVALRLFGHQSD